MTNQACCACLTVVFDPVRVEGGQAVQERWRCRSCGAEFVRSIHMESFRELERRLAEAEAAFATNPGASVSAYWRKRVEAAEAALEDERENGTMRLAEAQGERLRAEAAERERDELREHFADWEASNDKVLSEECPPDERHCTCVPFLRKRVEAAERERDRARAEVERHKSIVGEMAKDMARVAQAAGYFGECEPSAVVGAVRKQRAEVERLRGRVDYYESTVCLPGNPIHLACGETTEVVQPVRLGELVSRLDRALEVLREVEQYRRDGSLYEDVPGPNAIDIMWQRLAALLAETEEKPCVDQGQAMASEPLTRTDVRREINRWCSERGVTITLDTRDDLLRRLTGRI